MASMLKLVLPKGSLEEQTLRLMEAADLQVRRGSVRDYHGRIDDDPTDVGGSCTSGVGACATSGATVCQAGGLVCNATPGQRKCGQIGGMLPTTATAPHCGHGSTLLIAAASPVACVPYDDPATGQWSRPPAFPSGAGGLVSTVRDYDAFAEMLRGSGERRGTRGSLVSLAGSTLAFRRAEFPRPGTGCVRHFPETNRPAVGS